MSKKIKKIALLTVVVLCTLFIFYNSSKTGNVSNEITCKIARKLVGIKQTIDPGPISYEVIGRVNVIIRNIAHGVEFCILAIAIQFFSNTLKRRKKNWIITIFIIISLAVSDEISQLFVDGRNFSYLDMIIDSIGGAIGIILIETISYIKRKIILYESI